MCKLAKRKGYFALGSSRGKVSVSLLLALASWTGSVWGQSVAPFPSGTNVAITQSTALNTNWIVRDPAAGQANSARGLFVASAAGACPVVGEEIFGTVSLPLTANVANGVGIVPETLRIPQNVTNRAQASGVSRFFYCREFALPGGSTQTARVTCRPGGSAFANFSIARVNILFQNQRSEITIPLDKPDLSVYADVRYNGTGVLKAQWEIREPGAAGSSSFRVLDIIRKFIPYGDRILIQRPKIPPLPTNIPGEYRVALRVVDPPAGFALPVARYFVESRKDVRREQPIRLIEPAESSTQPQREISFRWEGIPAAVQYRLVVAKAEVLPPTDVASRISEGAPTQQGATSVPLPQVVSQLVKPGDTVILALTPARTSSYKTRPDQLKKFQPGALYTWKVQALDDKGQVIGESQHLRFTFGRGP